tara:strand:- start:464 stop:667 length:204 start_codon:yes stop_codon:yes gene_type:complete
MKTILETLTIQIEEQTKPTRTRVVPPVRESKLKIKTQVGILDSHIIDERNPRFFSVEGGQTFSIIKF